ncbi:MAG: hypothetical protein ACK55P_02850 [Planctomyces sp.]|jgi:hypothetical protein
MNQLRRVQGLAYPTQAPRSADVKTGEIAGKQPGVPTLEQQTGRLDRIRSKAEQLRRPICIAQPFIAGGADEKMFRVLRDRERWFQVVMGQKFEFDEAASEELAQRVPLPVELAERLTFDLTRWKMPVGLNGGEKSGAAESSVGPD